MSHHIKRITAVIVFLLSSMPVSACTTAFNAPLTYPFTGNVPIIVNCQGEVCHSPALLSDPLISYHSSDFDTDNFQYGFKFYTVNLSTNGGGSFVPGVTVVEDGVDVFCAAAPHEITVDPNYVEPTQSPPTGGTPTPTPDQSALNDFQTPTPTKETVPTVPEFNILTGALTLITSVSAFSILKKREK